MTSPVSETRLKQIATDACDSALSKASIYTHADTEQWNGAIINSILQALISESKPSADAHTPYKFAVNSTIIQHLQDPKPAGTDSEATGERKVGRRGMHSAAGAYWNNEKDGMWSFKYEGGEAKGMDVVVSIIWIAI
ncbi:dynein light chain, cytosolic [Myriangium duriaei CBS 260.36]|uniref:Dynein light chain, cytosolic n=1 Tax=Myriangium duriaei CBS 260.36 TaxID=1168546 RepID=A0A9P4MLA1_9PEZI|nr:dynein light chain, cytosolic [Myriangium duriaei CBS 260.36]